MATVGKDRIIRPVTRKFSPEPQSGIFPITDILLETATMKRSSLLAWRAVALHRGQPSLEGVPSSVLSFDAEIPRKIQPFEKVL